MPKPTETILLVEDTQLIRQMYHDKLAEEGYEVLVAENGLEALNVLRSEHVDLVVLDLIMPQMGGLEALEAMKADQRTCGIPVIILSNLGEDESVKKAVELGAFDYLVKNSSKPADVSAKIRFTLDALGGRARDDKAFRMYVQDRALDADALIEAAGLPQRFWCPRCQEELVLEMVPLTDRPGWYQAHLLCPSCGMEY